MCVQANSIKTLLLQKRNLRTFFFMRNFDHTTENYSEHNIDTVFDLFPDAVFKEVIYQKLGKSPVNFWILVNKITVDKHLPVASECYVQNLLDLTAYYNRSALKCSRFTIFFRLIVVCQRN